MKNPLKSFKGGIHPLQQKTTAELATEVMKLPSKVVIPMLQHIGGHLTPLVKKGDNVMVGEKIGDSQGFFSAPVHSSVSGIVKDVKPIIYPGGFEVLSIEIEPDGLQQIHSSVKPLDSLDNESLLKKIKESGLVGLGGAGFPTSIKLSPPPDKKLEVLIANGAECEPYISSDYREMMENTQSILEGIKIVMGLTGIKTAYVAIESNKPKALELVSKLAKEFKGIEVVNLRTRYPQGGEKQLIYAVTGRKVPSGKLPSDIGVLVQNINTLSFIADYVKTGMPLIKKKISVGGQAVENPKNLEVLIGTPLKEVFEFCGGFVETPEKIIMGGPMMGVAQFSLDNSVIKQTNSLLAFTHKEAAISPEGPCIRCGKCVTVCPMNLLPLYLNLNVYMGRFSENEKYHINDCIECGCCSYTCPASRHLVQSIRFGKSELKKIAQK